MNSRTSDGRYRTLEPSFTKGHPRRKRRSRRALATLRPVMCAYSNSSIRGSKGVLAALSRSLVIEVFIPLHGDMSTSSKTSSTGRI